MLSPTTVSRSEWKPTHIPKLSYRSVLEIDECRHENPYDTTRAPSPRECDDNFRSPTLPNGHSTRSNTTAPTSVGQARMSTTTGPRASMAPGLPNKKKGSLLGSFFAKEASSQALEQVAAQLIAQHGELSPRAVPGVSSAKMPDFVPKVNSKWDGVPEVARMKEKEKKKKQRQQTSQRFSVASNGRTESEDSHFRSVRSSSPDGRHSNSTLNSSNGSSRLASKRHTVRPDRLSSQRPVDDLRHRAQDSLQSLRSPSGSSLPEITCFFPSDIPAPPSVPARFRYQEQHENVLGGLLEQRTTDVQRDQTQAFSSAHRTPHHSSSPTATPQELSPVTPVPDHHPEAREHFGFGGLQQDSAKISLVSNGPTALGPPAISRRKPKAVTEAFLAGEARPLEVPGDSPSSIMELSVHRREHVNVGSIPAISRLNLEERPDSSRGRLGLRASMLIETGAMPWAAEQDNLSTPLGAAGSRTSVQVNSKVFLAKGLGRLAKDKTRK